MRPGFDIAAAFIAKLEACRLSPYKDVGGIWTQGYGHTGVDVDTNANHNRYITKDIAMEWLKADLHVADERLGERVDAAKLAALSEHEYAALLSFVFNVGANPAWTIWRVLNSGNLDDVPTQLMRFDKAHVNGVLVEVKGLKNRRMAEIAMWNTGDARAATALAPAAIANPSSAVTRNIVTPPTPQPVPLFKTSAVTKAVATVGSAATAVAAAGQTIQTQAQPFAHISPLFQHVLVIGAALALGGSLAAVFVHQLQHKAAAQ